MRKKIIFLTAFIISGCTTLSRDKETIRVTIDQWVEQEEYGKALSELTGISPNSPHYAEFSGLRGQVLSKAEKYEQKLIGESSRLQKQGQLFEALQVIKDGLENHPESTTLKDFLAHLLSERKLQVEILEFKLKLTHANYLEKALKFHKEIAALQADSFFASRRYQSVRTEADDVALELTKIGLALVQRDKSKAAENYFSTALRLSDAEAIKSASQHYFDTERIKHTQRAIDAERTKSASLRKISAAKAQKHKKQQLRKQQQRKVKKRREQKQKEQLKKQLSLFEQSIGDKNFEVAKRALTEIKLLSSNDKFNKNLHARYQKPLHQEVTRTYQLGVRYYSSERYKQALAAWQNTLELDSTHEQALESVKRVKRVLAKIEKLKKKSNSY